MSESSCTDDRDYVRKAKMEEFYFQRRLLFGCTVGLLFGVLLWIIAMSTNHWYIVDGGDGKYVENTRRYFKNSQTGIWRTCRKTYTPTPTAAYVVRNYTTLAYRTKDLADARIKFREDDFVKDFLKVELPALDDVTEIDENFRQQLFAEWITGNEKHTERFEKLKEKLKSWLDTNKFDDIKTINPGDFAEVNKKFGDLITEMDFNTTSKVKVAVPQELRFALFDKWEDHGLRFVKLLYHYSKSLGIDANIYKNNIKWLFVPPPPQKKPYNGFTYVKNRQCTFTNLFAHTDEEIISNDPSMDVVLLEFSRTAATFTIFTIFLIVLGFVFTVYTFFNPRYMFKRLAGGVHIISGSTSIIVCKVMWMMRYHSEEFMKSKFPIGCKFQFGYGFFFGVFVSAINFFSAIMFLWYSKKKKGDKAATEELGMADEPIQIGR